MVEPCLGKGKIVQTIGELFKIKVSGAHPSDPPDPADPAEPTSGPADRTLPSTCAGGRDYGSYTNTLKLDSRTVSSIRMTE